MSEKRTIQQNAAIHQYLAMLSTDLNSAGLDIRQTMKADFDIPWSAEAAKALIWKPVMQAMCQVGSTTEMTTEQVDAVYQAIARHLAAKGITTPFPSDESLSEQQRDERWKEIGNAFREAGK